MLLALTSIIACSLAASGLRLQSRAATTQAVCPSDFAWANNSKSESPCQVLANVDALCNNNNWTVAALNGSSIYAVPTGLFATPCTCSWVSYNLISACTACQGNFYVDAVDLHSWPPFIFGCTGKLTNNTFFPVNFTTQETLVPHWATTDPTTWPNEQFSVVQAENLSTDANLADITSTTSSPSTSSKSKSNIGAIVGGVVGGLIVLVAAIVIGIYIIRRTSQPNGSQLSSNDGPSSALMSNHTHLRSRSDVTGNSNNMSSSMGYTSLSSSPMRAPTSPTIRTHGTSSIRSFPFFSSAGSTVPSPPSVRQQSPPPVSVREETAVEPFVLPPSNTPNPDRKQANGAYTTYDPPTAPPSTVLRMDIVRPTTPTQGGRSKYNPPAYTEQTKGSPEAEGSRRRPTPGRVHGKKGSADTQHSIASIRSGGGSATRGGTNNSVMANVVNPLPPARAVIIPQSNPHGNGSTSSNVIPPLHTRQLSGNTSTTSLNAKRRPKSATDDGFSLA
ncbi:hypothetical protein BYT27DRAFT_7123403 [Phlegmacium glaucopus]|nr:hypothetical protein BYT27DRAFT_7123403 [Phlegmacium glaucopus]